MCLRRPASGWISADMRIRNDKPTLDDVFFKYAGAAHTVAGRLRNDHGPDQCHTHRRAALYRLHHPRGIASVHHIRLCILWPDNRLGEGDWNFKEASCSPTSIYATVIGRSVASGVRAVVQALIIFPVAILLGVKFIANPFYIAAAFLILFLVSGGFAAISILVASIMKTRERFMGLGQALIMPLFFASNALYPIDMMPSALQLFAVLNPLTYAVDAIRGLMISGELGNILVDVLAILVFDMVVFALASLSFRKILE